jgi:hypothetical protein
MKILEERGRGKRKKRDKRRHNGANNVKSMTQQIRQLGSLNQELLEDKVRNRSGEKEAAASQSAVTQELQDLRSEVERQNSIIDKLKADNDRLNRALKEKERQEELEREPERPNQRARENEVLQQPGRTTIHERPHSDSEDDRAIGRGRIKAIVCPPHVPPSVHYGSVVCQAIKEEEVERILDHSFQLTPQSTQSAA